MPPSMWHTCPLLMITELKGDVSPILVPPSLLTFKKKKEQEPEQEQEQEQGQEAEVEAVAEERDDKNKR